MRPTQRKEPAQDETSETKAEVNLCSDVKFIAWFREISLEFGDIKLKPDNDPAFTSPSAQGSEGRGRLTLTETQHTTTCLKERTAKVQGMKLVEEILWRTAFRRSTPRATCMCGRPVLGRQGNHWNREICLTLEEIGVRTVGSRHSEHGG